MTKHSKPSTKRMTSNPSPQRQLSSLIDEICGIPAGELVKMDKTEAWDWLDKARLVSRYPGGIMIFNRITKQKGEK